MSIIRIFLALVIVTYSIAKCKTTQSKVQSDPEKAPFKALLIKKCDKDTYSYLCSSGLFVTGGTKADGDAGCNLAMEQVIDAYANRYTNRKAYIQPTYLVPPVSTETLKKFKDALDEKGVYLERSEDRGISGSSYPSAQEWGIWYLKPKKSAFAKVELRYNVSPKLGFTSTAADVAKTTKGRKGGQLDVRDSCSLSFLDLDNWNLGSSSSRVPGIRLNFQPSASQLNAKSFMISPRTFDFVEPVRKYPSTQYPGSEKFGPRGVDFIWQPITDLERKYIWVDRADVPGRKMASISPNAGCLRDAVDYAEDDTKLVQGVVGHISNDDADVVFRKYVSNYDWSTGNYDHGYIERNGLDLKAPLYIEEADLPCQPEKLNKL